MKIQPRILARVRRRVKQHDSPRFMFRGAAIITALITVNLFLGFRSIFQLWGESQAYANTAIPPILTSWNANALIDRASPEFLQGVMQSDLEQSFDELSRRFGNLQQYRGVDCRVNSSLIWTDDPTSHCRALLIFEKTAATLEIELIRHEDNWQIYDFQVYQRLENRY